VHRVGWLRAAVLGSKDGIVSTASVEQELARKVAAQLMGHDALGAHALDKLGIFRPSGPARHRPH
jgi:VIT1/CCC1 family predicted Fe2+/Mn2+ transporter